MMTIGKRTVLRSLILILSVLAAAGALPFVSALWLPAASPFVAACSIATHRTFSLISLIALPLLLLGAFRGRWFCYHLCPAGFFMELMGRLNGRRKTARSGAPRVGVWLVVAGIGGAIVGFPLFLWLDPLVFFSGFFGAVRRLPGGWKELAPGLVFVIVAVLSALAPGAWCQRLCPLGASLEQLGRLQCSVRNRMVRRPEGCEGAVGAETDARTGSFLGRRTFLFLLGGAGAGAAARMIGAWRPAGALRPPGAVGEDVFRSLCARCGNCFRACPQNIIVPDLGKTGLAGVFSPTLDFRNSYCDEWCNECGKVCPTGAIRRLTLEEKRLDVIGNAAINREKCLAWKYGNYCMVCQEFCPYQAIESEEHGGVNCPVVNEKACRGCGACQSQCPAQPDMAIVVHPGKNN